MKALEISGVTFSYNAAAVKSADNHKLNTLWKISI